MAIANRFSSILEHLINIFRQPPSPGTYLPYPKLRNFILDIMAEGRRKNTIHLLFEADITQLRHHLDRYNEETGQHISLTACIAQSLACAIGEDRSMHAYRHGKSRLVLFDEIDLAIMIERDIVNGSMPVVSIIRAANQKGISEMNEELKTAKTAPLGGNGPMSTLEKQFFSLPGPVRKCIWFFIRRDPHLFKQLAGTVGVTSMGMYANGSAVVFPITPMTLTLSIGSIDKKIILENGDPVEHEIIWLNLSADHDIIDGAPLVRFSERFKIKLQNVLDI